MASQGMVESTDLVNCFVDVCFDYFLFNDCVRLDFML